MWRVFDWWARRFTRRRLMRHPLGYTSAGLNEALDQ
jgi:hypothetical protein